jgi:hypothetical protein
VNLTCVTTEKNLPRQLLPILLVAGLALTAAAPLPVNAQESIDPQKLVQDAVYNELAPGNHLNFRFTLQKVDAKGVTTKELVETKDGDVARLISHGDQPLSAAEEQAEKQRLDALLADPARQARRHKKEQQDSKHGDELVRVLPNAFVYKYAGMEPGPNGPAYRLTFEPNPNFIPPDYEARVFHGMAGELWIDQKEKRMVRFQAHLISDVEFGWGVLGRLYKGGTILVEQTDVGKGHWEQLHLKLNLTGKEMMFKDLKEQTTEDESNFHEVPSTWSYQDAIHFLENNSVEQLKQ